MNDFNRFHIIAVKLADTNESNINQLNIHFGFEERTQCLLLITNLSSLFFAENVLFEFLPDQRLKKSNKSDKNTNQSANVQEDFVERLVVTVDEISYHEQIK